MPFVAFMSEVGSPGSISVYLQKNDESPWNFVVDVDKLAKETKEKLALLFRTDDKGEFLPADGVCSKCYRDGELTFCDDCHGGMEQIHARLRRRIAAEVARYHGTLKTLAEEFGLLYTRRRGVGGSVTTAAAILSAIKNQTLDQINEITSIRDAVFRLRELMNEEITACSCSPAFRGKTCLEVNADEALRREFGIKGHMSVCSWCLLIGLAEGLQQKYR